MVFSSQFCNLVTELVMGFSSEFPNFVEFVMVTVMGIVLVLF
jgi:hypothetical protein